MPAPTPSLPPTVSSRELRNLALLVLLAAVVVSGVWPFLAHRSPRPALVTRSQQVMPGATGAIDLTATVNWPEAAVVAEQSAAARLLLGSPGSARFSELTPLALAWARAQREADRERPPLPMRVEDAEILGGQLRPAQALLVDGRIVGRAPQPDEAGGERLAVALPDGRQIEVLADASLRGLDLEVPARFVLRYLTEATRSQVGGGEGRYRIFVASSGAAAAASPTVTSLLGLGALPDPSRATWRPDPAAFDGIDDVRPGLELGPYYYLLGWAAAAAQLPPPTATAPLAADHARELHFRPEQQRGAHYQLRGTIIDAFYDQMVERDQPYGVGRALRLWVLDVVSIRDPAMAATAAAQRTIVLYELCMPMTEDVPLPANGSRVESEGRFLKMHGYAVPEQYFASRDVAVRRATDVTYFQTFVVPRMRITPVAEPSLVGLQVVVLSVCFGSLAVGLWLMRQNRRGDGAWKRHLPQQRARRRLWQRSQRAAADSQEADGTATNEEEPRT
jgi:hypothetical protein